MKNEGVDYIEAWQKLSTVFPLLDGKVKFSKHNNYFPLNLISVKSGTRITLNYIHFSLLTHQLLTLLLCTMC
jgi:hypothetical protein